MGGLKSILKSSGVYFSFSIVNRLIPFLLLPILTRYIDPAGFGVISVVTTISSLAMPLLGFCSNSVLYQKFYTFEVSELSGFLKASYKIIFSGLIFSALVIAAFSSQLRAWLEVSSSWLFMGVLCAALGMVSTLTMSLYQLQNRPFLYGMLQTAGALLNFSTAVTLVVYLGLSWEGRVWAMVISAAVLCSIAVIASRRYIIASSDNAQQNQVISILRLGGALMPSAFSGWVIAMSDRLFLTTLTSLEVVGIYAIGASIAQVTEVVLSSIAQAYLPHIFKYGKAGGNENARAIVRSIYFVISLSILVGISMAIAGPIVISLLLDESYHDAQSVVSWICLSYVLFSIGALFQALLLVEERNHLTAYISVATVASSVLANIYFIAHFQMIGAAIASAFTGGVFLVTNFILVRLYKPMPWFDKKIFFVD